MVSESIQAGGPTNVPRRPNVSNGVLIFLDDDFAHPLYANPDPEDVDSELFRAICERVSDAMEDDGPVNGSVRQGDVRIAWRVHLGTGLTFAAFADDVKHRRLDGYLKSVSQRYFDEVDDVRSPDRNGVEDVVIDVIPPWEDEDEDED